MLKVDDVQGVWLEIDGDELEQVKFIAGRSGISLSEAISIARKNFWLFRYDCGSIRAA